jgi:hypothetical protein
MLPVGMKRVGDAVEFTAGAAASSYCGIGIDNTGAMMFDANPPDQFPNGTPVRTATQGLCAISYAARNLPVTFQNGFMTDFTGRIVTVTAGTAVAPLQQQNGYTFDANWALLTT